MYGVKLLVEAAKVLNICLVVELFVWRRRSIVKFIGVIIVDYVSNSNVKL